MDSRKNNYKSFSGGYGFVAVPDYETIEKCYAFTKEKFPEDWEYLISPKYLPHITLYHSKMREVPEEFALEMRDNLASSLVGLNFTLNALECFGAKFIFWNVTPSGSSYERLIKCHQEALQLAKYLDKTASKRAEEEGLVLTDREKENVELFNHPLVRDLYMPHITLAYDERAIGFLQKGESENFTMTIEKVEFAEIGHPGVVIDIISF
jgi:2'-5' RNA ligase